MDEQKVSYAIFMLKGTAYNHWRMIGPNTDDDEQLTWEGLQSYFIRKVRVIISSSGKHVFSAVPDEYKITRKFQQGQWWNI